MIPIERKTMRKIVDIVPLIFRKRLPLKRTLEKSGLSIFAFPINLNSGFLIKTGSESFEKL